MAHAPDEPAFREVDTSLLPGENPELAVDLIDAFGEQWLRVPSLLFGNRTPEQVLGAQDKFRLRLLLRSHIVADLS